MVIGPEIDWQMIGAAVSYYRRLGYQYIETKWIEEPRWIQTTVPSEIHMQYVVTGGALIGSAEQSLVAMSARKEIPPGWYVSASPCFRIERNYNEFYRPYFFKVELFRSIQIGTLAVEDTLHSAKAFFSSLLTPETQSLLTEEKTDEGYDINLCGIEIGSYGFRERDGQFWVYGTGLAEPRFSVAKKKAISSLIEK